jgi:para-nitrobenzyl esterase
MACWWDRCGISPTLDRAGQPVWLYRFSFVSQAQRGTNMGALHGLEIPFAITVPAAPAGSVVTPTDKGRSGQRLLGAVRQGRSGRIAIRR